MENLQIQVSQGTELGLDRQKTKTKIQNKKGNQNHR